MNEPLFRRLRPLVESIASAIEPLLDRPYALCGHSIGGLTAFELGRCLSARGAPRPGHLFVAASPPPHAICSLEPLSYLDDGALLQEVDRRYGGIPEEVLTDPELQELFLPPLRADLEMIENYEHHEAPELDCPVSAFAGLQDEQLPPHLLLEWRRYTSGLFIPRVLPGGHFILRESRRLLLDAMIEDLEDTFG